MSEIVEVIRKVAAFADKQESETFTLADVHFRKGEVYAQSMVGGALEPIELELNCGVNAKKLLKALQAVGKAPKFEMVGKQLKVSKGKSRAKLETSDPKHAPKLHRPPKGAEWLEVPHLHEASRLVWAVSTDTTRTHIAGVCLSARGLCATNGHAAIKLGEENYCELLGCGEASAPLIPPAVLKNLPNPTFACLHQGKLYLAAESKPKAFRSANLYDARFPSMEQVMETGRGQPRLSVDRSALVDLLKRARLSSHSAVLEVKGKRLSVSIDDTRPADTLFSFADSVEFTKVSGEVPDGLISLNLNYLLPSVETCSDKQVTLGMLPEAAGSLEPIYVTDGDIEAIMMPMRM